MPACPEGDFLAFDFGSVFESVFAAISELFVGQFGELIAQLFAVLLG